MDITNAIKIRQNLGAVLARLTKTGKAIRVEKNRKPVAALILWEDYLKRFVDRDADEARKEIVAKILNSKLSIKNDATSLDIIHNARR